VRGIGEEDWIKTGFFAWNRGIPGTKAVHCWDNRRDGLRRQENGVITKTEGFS